MTPRARTPPLRTAPLALVLLLVACAGSPRAHPEAGLAVRRAIHEAYEELPGALLTDHHFALDGEMWVTVAAPDSATARAALDAGFAAADSVDRLVSVHHAGSEIAAINAAAGREPVVVSPWTETLIAASLDWARRTGGAFDPTVGPLVNAWGFGCEPCATPNAARIREALSHVGWRKVEYDPEAHTVHLPDPEMRLDVRAAAKGFALDRMRDAMLDTGATAGIADLGGAHLFFGPGTESGDRRLWPVELPDPYDPRHSFATLEIPPGVVSSTSPYSRVVETGQGRVGHLIDPRDGQPATGLASVTVFARDGVQSDILSTALYVLARGGECSMIEGWDDVGAIFVIEAEPGGRSLVCVTEALRGRVKDLDPPFRPLVRDDD